MVLIHVLESCYYYNHYYYLNHVYLKHFLKQLFFCFALDIEC